jgi:5,10-methylenetetrahydrofolate reductase
MVFDLDRLATFLDQASDLLAGVRFYAGVALLRSAAMADRASTLPGVDIPRRSRDRIMAGEGLVLAKELASELAAVPGVDALHLFPLGAERETVEIAASFRERLR